MGANISQSHLITQDEFKRYSLLDNGGSCGLGEEDFYSFKENYLYPTDVNEEEEEKKDSEYLYPELF